MNLKIYLCLHRIYVKHLTNQVKQLFSKILNFSLSFVVYFWVKKFKVMKYFEVICTEYLSTIYLSVFRLKTNIYGVNLFK